jgi:hypothetical protein
MIIRKFDDFRTFEGRPNTNGEKEEGSADIKNCTDTQPPRLWFENDNLTEEEKEASPFVFLEPANGEKVGEWFERVSYISDENLIAKVDNLFRKVNLHLESHIKSDEDNGLCPHPWNSECKLCDGATLEIESQMQKTVNNSENR